jgi:hypothetical protein
MAKDDIDFDAYMRDRGVQRMDVPAPGGPRPAAPAVGSSDPKVRAQLEALQRALAVAQAERDELRRGQAAAQAERDELRRGQAAAQAERDEARRGQAAAQVERDELRRGLAVAQAERDAVAKERAALQRRMSAAPVTPAPSPLRATLREVLFERGVEDETEAAELLLALLGHSPADLLDALEARPELVERIQSRLALVCERAECQPGSPHAVVVRVSPERCEVCGGSDIRVAFELLVRACGRAGVTRLVIVGGSPSYRTQLKELARGTKLKLDLVSGDSKLGKRRARNDAERVVIWGATEIDHGTSAAYEHLGDRRISVPHRGISRMLRKVAEVLG